MLAAWSGLGIYRRAHMLHTAAKVVVRELGGSPQRLPRHGASCPVLDATPPPQSPALPSEKQLPWSMEMSGAFCGVSSGSNWRQRGLAHRCRVTRSRTAGRFQSGGDGTGRDRLHAPRARLSNLSSSRVVRNPGRDGWKRSGRPPAKARNPLCTRFSGRRGVPGAAPARRVVDARNVGAALNGIPAGTTESHPKGQERQKHWPCRYSTSVYIATFHHRYRLHGSCLGPHGEQKHSGQMDPSSAAAKGCNDGTGAKFQKAIDRSEAGFGNGKTRHFRRRSAARRFII